ncbi:MAG: hypothetical protein VB934_16580, partial [Polyangiaceae bacterium]
MSQFRNICILTLSFCGLLLGQSGCELIAAVDRTLINDGSGGAATTSTGGTGGTTTSTGGTGGTGGGPECTEPSDCGADTDCKTFSCTDGACASADADENTVCDDGMGCDASNPCVCDDAGSCVLKNCTDKLKNGDETDVDCGGSCDPCENTKVCGANGDCESGYCNTSGGSGGSGGSAAAGVCAPCTQTTQCDDDKW